MINSALKNANILIVDDQESNVYILEFFLSSQGYTNIKTTTDPRQVVRLFASSKPDLVLLDLMMPYLSGFEVMEQLKSLIAANTYLPILVLTADTTTESKQRALSGGASDFLTKPFDLTEVGLRIHNLLYTCYLQQQLQNQNEVLEGKVNERTAELIEKNLELINAKEKAEASDRLKTSFINNISHEIRTPLNGILGFGQILADAKLSDEEKDLYLQMLNESSLRIINTVTSIMDISLLSSGNQEVFVKEILLKPGILDVIEKYADTVKKKQLSLAFHEPEINEDFKIYTDVELLKKVIHQLIDNALKFTPQGSVDVGYEINGKFLHFFVKDNGIGISSENQQRIFDDFIQEDNANTRRYEGSGLGLSIAKRIVELLNGKIWLDSEKGKGSTFHFALPCLEPATQKKPVSETPHAPKKENQQTVLIVEDDEIIYFYLSVLIKHDLIEILYARNGIEAIEICQTHSEITLVLIDLKMPGKDGFEVTRLIKSVRNDLQIFAIAAYSESEERQKAMQAGCDEFITKPLKKETLVSKLELAGLPVSH